MLLCLGVESPCSTWIGDHSEPAHLALNFRAMFKSPCMILLGPVKSNIVARFVAKWRSSQWNESTDLNTLFHWRPLLGHCVCHWHVVVFPINLAFDICRNIATRTKSSKAFACLLGECWGKSKSPFDLPFKWLKPSTFACVPGHAHRGNGNVPLRRLCCSVAVN